MKLRDYLDALRIEENTAVGIRINENRFGNVIRTVPDVAQYWNYEDDESFRDAIDSPEMAYRYEHRLRYHKLSDHSLSQVQDLLDYDFVAVTPMVNPESVKAYMTHEPDELSPIGNPLVIAWGYQKVAEFDKTMEACRADLLVLNVLVKKPEG